MKRIFLIVSVALLIIGHTLLPRRIDALIGAPDDLIELHSIIETSIC